MKVHVDIESNLDMSPYMHTIVDQPVVSIMVTSSDQSPWCSICRSSSAVVSSQFTRNTTPPVGCNC